MTARGPRRPLATPIVTTPEIPKSRAQAVPDAPLGSGHTSP